MRGKTRRMGRGMTGRAARGFTMMEVMIASAIMIMATTAAVSALTYSMRCNKAQRTQLAQARDTLALQRTIKSAAISASRIIENGGRTVRIIQPDGSESQLAFDNGDGSDGTTSDNTLVWDPDTAVDGDERQVIQGLGEYVDPETGAIAPIFSIPGTIASLRVQFRLGDQTPDGAGEENAHTGIGNQTYVFDSIFAARNSSI